MLRAMPEFAVTAIGRDRPGIVAAVSGALLELSGNVEDSQMSILRGHFAVMLIVRLPDPVDEPELEARLGRVRQELDLEAIAVNRVDDLGVGAARPSHVITVYGADHPGIVHAVSAALAGRGVNITGLETRLAGADDSPLYVMIIEAAVPEASGPDLEAALRRVADEAEVEVSMRPLAADAL
jgi:glycine cleavage system transcriptional repressor